MMIKSVAATLVAVATTLGAGAAHAGGQVSWAVGINSPGVGAVVSNGPVYAPVPFYAAEPVYVAPRVVVPAPVYYYPGAPVYYGPVVYPQPYMRWHHRHHPHWAGHAWRYD